VLAHQSAAKVAGRDERPWIRDARIAIGCGAIYFYNMVTGTRYLTCAEFARLGALATEELALQLRKSGIFPDAGTAGTIRKSTSSPPTGSLVTRISPRMIFCCSPWNRRSSRRVMKELLRRFVAAVPPALIEDDIEDAEWRRRMVSALVSQRERDGVG